MFERIKELDRRTLIPLLLAGVIGILLFSTVVGGIRQAGWNEGFMVGLLANGGEQAKAVAPTLATGDGYHGIYGVHRWGGHGFGFIGGFFRFLFFGFLLLMFVKFIAFRRWRMHGGHPWHHHPHGPWARPGGWGPQQGHPYSQQPEQPQAAPGNQPPPAQPENPTAQPVSWVKM